MFTHKTFFTHILGNLRKSHKKNRVVVQFLQSKPPGSILVIKKYFKLLIELMDILPL